jgi:Uma2 family endonuclease
MSIAQSQAASVPPFALAEVEPDYDRFITEDEKPVDSIYSERQHRLLTDALCASWSAPQGQPHLAATDVGLFYSVHEPAIAPDVMLSTGVAPPSEWTGKKNRSYFTWLMGKCPDLTVEVVSNQEGGELTEKKGKYAHIGIPYYVVWDPALLLSKTPLSCFVLKGKKYDPCEPWFPDLELGVTEWDGEYDGMTCRWLRFCDQAGHVLPTGIERAKIAEQRAESAEQRAALLAEKLRALGVEPDPA